MPKAYSYIRFSSEGQARGDSLRRQIQKAEDFVRKTSSTLGLELDTTLSLSDPAMSAYRGTNLKRGALAAFIAAVENGSVEDGSFLLVESFDRLSRQQSDKSLRLLLDLVDAGVTVVTLNDEKIYNKETLSGTDGTFAIMSSLISMSRAHEESALKGSRVRAAWANKIANISKGKQLTKKVPFWLTVDRELKPEKVALVKEIYQLHSTGHGATVIAKLLNNRNEPTPTGKGNWQQSTIRKLVTGKQTLGILVTTDKTEHLNYFPQIITEELWLKANVMTGTGRATKSSTNTKPLRGLLRCSCGSSMRTQSRTGRLKVDGTRNRWDYFVCALASVGGKGCAFISIPQETVFKRLCEELPYFELSGDTVKDSTVQTAKSKQVVEMATEDLERAYEVFKKAKTSTARNRVVEMEKQLQNAQEALNLLYQTNTETALNLQRTLLTSPRPKDNVWWRQLVEYIEINTPKDDQKIKVVFHGGREYSFHLNFNKYGEGVLSGASLRDLVLDK